MSSPDFHSGPMIEISEFDPITSPRPVCALEERRQETHQIRQLWLNLQAKRKRLRSQEDTYLSHHTVSPRSRKSSYLLPRSDDGKLARSAPAFKKRHLADQCDQIPYHTAITERPTKHLSTTMPQFNALNRRQVHRLPDIYDRPPRVPSFTTRDIREWRNEITKVVPERPPIYTPTSSQPREMSQILPPQTEVTKDSLCMFNPVSPRRKGRGKDYVVNPEWPSEEVSPESVRDRAHCVYNWFL